MNGRLTAGQFGALMAHEPTRSVDFAGVYDSGYATADDPPEVVAALARLSAKGCHGEAMRRAGDLLRARDCRGQFLLVTDTFAMSEFHYCFWADKPLFDDAAWVVRVPPAEEVEP